MAVHMSGDMIKSPQALRGIMSAHFVIKKLQKSQVPEQRLSQSCRLMIPAWFVRKHGDKFRQVVVLRSGASTKPCRVHLNVVFTRLRIPEIKLGRGWREFARSNKLVVGDSLIFELSGISEFTVHIFRSSTNHRPTAVSSSIAAPKKLPNTDSELHQKSGNGVYSSHLIQHLATPVRDPAGSADRLSELCIAKRKDIAKERAPHASASRPTLQISSCINLHPVSQLETAPTLSLATAQLHHGSQDCQKPPTEKLKPPKFSQPADDCAQICNTRKTIINGSKLRHPPKLSRPSFIQQLVAYNVQDAVGNTCGAFLEVPASFVMAYGVRAAHVHLQGIREESPVRPVTAKFCFLDAEKETSGELLPSSSTASGVPLVYCLGWGDFVRENALQAGLALVFTLAGESFFLVRERSESTEVL